MNPDQFLERLSALIARARAKGADAADAVLVESASLTVSRRLGEVEQLARAENREVGLRVFSGRRQAIASSSDFSPIALDALVDRAMAMVRAVPEDPHAGLADPAELATEFPDLDACDPVEPAPEELSERARRAEEAARAVPGVTNSEGAQASWGRGAMALVASNGFAHGRVGTYHSLAVSVLAGEGTAMERDDDYASAVHAADLRAPEALGRSAGERAVRRLNPRKAETAKVPVVYDSRVAGGLLRHLASAINGQSVARGSSFLRDKLGQRIFPENVIIVDDPLRRRGLNSRPFDGEGLACRPLNLIDRGVLTTWVMDLRSARQLGLRATGHAVRGTGGPPSPSTSNLYLQPGALSPEAMMADIKSGLYVTELMGFGVNGVTGDYSRGAAGFWIVDGQLAHPVSELTIAGNLKDMFLHLTAATDLQFRYGTDAPTVRIEGMTVAGR